MDERRTADHPTPGSVPAPRFDDRSDGWTLAAELLTATFLWGGIGWLVDRWLGTGPVIMALGFVLGNALGIYLIWLRSQDRFTQEHADLMARRARQRSVAPGIVPDFADVADVAGDPGAAVTSGGSTGVLPDVPPPDVAFNDEVVAPIYDGDRHD